MNARERVYLLIIALVIGAAAVAVGALGLSAVDLYFLRTSLENLYGSLEAVLAAVLLAVLALVILVFSLRRGESVETLLSHSQMGELRICFKAIENLVLKAARTVNGVREVKTKMVQSENGLTIFLRAVTFPDLNIPQISTELQAAVKEYVETTTGATVAEVKVMIENVVAEQSKPARFSQ